MKREILNNHSINLYLKINYIYLRKKKLRGEKINMPGGDRTGPRGFGSMTGRGLGYCAGYESPGYAKGSGMGRAWGRGRGVGYGRGWGRGYRIPVYRPSIAYAPVHPPYASRIVPPINPENQLSTLKQEKEYLESEMKGIQNVIDEISKRIVEFEKEE